MSVNVFQSVLAVCVNRFVVQLVDVNERWHLAHGNRIQRIRTLLVRPETEVYLHHVVCRELLFRRTAVGLWAKVECAEVSETYTLGILHQLYEAITGCHQHAKDSCAVERRAVVADVLCELLSGECFRVDEASIPSAVCSRTLVVVLVLLCD